MSKQEAKSKALEDLSTLYKQMLQLESKRARAVLSARLAGASWREVGDAELVSTQVARRKYAAMVEEIHPLYDFPLDEPLTGP